LLAGARPIGVGPRFQPPARGPVLGRCRRGLGPRFPIHLELFAANRVVLIPTGIGTRPPRAVFAGRIVRASCYGNLVTLEPTGVVLVAAGRRATVGDLFRSWGQALSRTQLASFRAAPGRRVAVYVAGRMVGRSPGEVELTPRAEIVLEVGPHVPPHRTFTFPPGPR
jgi:hypothetical protein